MRITVKIAVAVAAFAAALTAGVVPAAQADPGDDAPWIHVGSYFSKKQCERAWRTKYAKRWNEHLCTLAARQTYWQLHVR